MKILNTELAGIMINEIKFLSLCMDTIKLALKVPIHILWVIIAMTLVHSPANIFRLFIYIGFATCNNIYLKMTDCPGQSILGIF